MDVEHALTRAIEATTTHGNMAEIPEFSNLSLQRHGNVFILTMQKPPENRLSLSFCQEMIRAFRTVESILGSDSEGAVITRSSDPKFWCTVCPDKLDRKLSNIDVDP